jgi:hypothetical protein
MHRPMIGCKILICNRYPSEFLEFRGIAIGKAKIIDSTHHEHKIAVCTRGVIRNIFDDTHLERILKNVCMDRFLSREGELFVGS